MIITYDVEIIENPTDVQANCGERDVGMWD